MSKAAQGFSPEAYVSTSPRQIHAGQEGGNPRRTPSRAKRAIYGWTLDAAAAPPQLGFEDIKIGLLRHGDHVDGMW